MAAQSEFGTTARRLAVVCGWVLVALAAVVLAGWAADSTLLTRISSELPSMKAISAVAIAAIGAGLVLLAPAERSPARERAGLGCGVFAALIGCAVLAEHAFGGFGLDELSFGDDGPDPGRPPLVAALGLVLLGLALVTLDRDAPRYRVTLVLQVAGTVLVVCALVGFAYDVDYLRGRSATAGIALHGTLAAAIALLGIALARPDRGAAAFFSGDDPASRLTRRLVPVAIFVPLVLGGLRLLGERADLFSDDVGLALVTLGSMAILLVVILVSARGLRTETARGDEVESSFQAVAEASIEAIVSADDRGAITYFNPSAERMFGYDAGEILCSKLKVLMPERYRDRHQAGLERFLATGERRVIGDTIELTGLRSDGEEFPISLSLVDWEADGKVFFTATIADIGARLAAEQKTRELAAIVEGSDDAVIGWSLDCRVRSWNRGAERIYGYSADEMLGRSHGVLMPPGQESELPMLIERVRDGGRIENFETARMRKDFRPIDVSLTVSRVLDEDGRMIAASTITRDITEQKTAERKLAAERRQLADAQQLASVGSWELDVATGQRIWSEQQFRNHGFDPSEPLPTFEQVLERIHPDDQVAVLRRMAEIEAGGYEFEYSYRLTLPDGRVREIETEGRPFTEADGSIRVMGTTRDITAERDAERLKEDFFGLVSHELRTPLTSIIGYTELLTEIEAENLSEQGRRFVEVIERNSRRELELVGDLLLLTRITAGTFEIEIGRADLGEIVATSAEAAEPDLGKAGVEISLDLVGAPVIEADPHRLGQVIDNLLSNAIKFTPRGGRIEIRATRDDERAVVSVADTGIGIPPEDAERLFERMFRAREAERRHIQGTGLGLTIVKAIVDAHDGTIEVESDIGRGTTFRVTLPVVARDRGEADDGQVAPPIAEGAERD